ncbi:MAG: TIGR02466 family protein [Hyphomicrobiales bacterium]
MPKTQDLFVTRIYRAELAGTGRLNRQLEAVALSLSQDDRAGRRWCARHGYPGYTSYASRHDLVRQFPEFARLVKQIGRHAALFARELHWDMRGTKPVCDSLWVNVMPEGGSHTSHIHRNSAISGTYYVAVPQGAGPIVFEDPRLAMLMAAPPRKKSAPRKLRTHVSETPKSGTLLLWESWLRHEVPLNRAAGSRISVSFNYCLG